MTSFILLSILIIHFVSDDDDDDDDEELLCIRPFLTRDECDNGQQRAAQVPRCDDTQYDLWICNGRRHTLLDRPREHWR